MQSNASDVTTQFLAELRVYTTLSRHRNVAAFLGCLEGVGMVLEYVDGPTLYEVIKAGPLPRPRKIDYHNQLLSGLCHLHSYGLSHGDLSLLNVQLQERSDTIKLLDFGRSVSAYSSYASPDSEPPDPLAHLQAALVSSLIQKKGRNAFSSPRTGDGLLARAVGKTLPTAPQPPRKVEQIHPGTRPFSAPEILRGECTDPLLADAYSFGMILVCIDRGEAVDVKPWDQRKDKLPRGFFDNCEVFRARAEEYLRRFDTRRRLAPEDEMEVA
jgi:serine/threonine protein kinase